MTTNLRGFRCALAGVIWIMAFHGASAAESQAGSFAEVSVTVGTGTWELPGTLTLPADAGPFPGVVLVHGSGPHDRDSTVGANKPFRDLAQGLAAKGIIVLRYDKRSRTHAQRIIDTLSQFTPDQETVDDAVAAVALMRELPDVRSDRVFVLGHSFGGMMAPRIAKRLPSLAGLIIMAGNTRPIPEMLLEQVAAQLNADGYLNGTEQAQLNALRQQVAQVDDPQLTPETPGILLGAGARYWLDLRDYHPEQVATQLTQPILILQGERDYQVTMEDFNGWKRTLAGRSDVTFKSYPTLNHLFVEGAGKSSPAEYARPGRVAQVVIDDIADWIMR